MFIVKRYSHKNIGYYFSEPITRFENIKFDYSDLPNVFIKFDYYKKTHKYILKKNKYGFYFDFGERYYIKF